MAEYIEREAAIAYAPLPKHLREYQTMNLDDAWENGYDFAIRQIESIPAADVRPVSEIEKIIENLQEQADIYNARAQELLVEEDGQVSQYTWAVSLRETYRRIIKTLDDLIS